jgi:hypothetical protein
MDFTRIRKTKIEVDVRILSKESIKKIKKLDKRIVNSYRTVEKRAFWILCYCYFVIGKDELIRWKQLEEAHLMGTETLARHLFMLRLNGYLEKMKIHSGTFYKLTDKTKQAMEQQLYESEILLQLRNDRA